MEIASSDDGRKYDQMQERIQRMENNHVIVYYTITPKAAKSVHPAIIYHDREGQRNSIKVAVTVYRPSEITVLRGYKTVNLTHSKHIS